MTLQIGWIVNSTDNSMNNFCKLLEIIGLKLKIYTPPCKCKRSSNFDYFKQNKSKYTLAKIYEGELEYLSLYKTINSFPIFFYEFTCNDLIETDHEKLFLGFCREGEIFSKEKYEFKFKGFSSFKLKFFSSDNYNDDETYKLMIIPNGCDIEESIMGNLNLESINDTYKILSKIKPMFDFKDYPFGYVSSRN